MQAKISHLVPVKIPMSLVQNQGCKEKIIFTPSFAGVSQLGGFVHAVKWGQAGQQSALGVPEALGFQTTKCAFSFLEYLWLKFCLK